MVLKRKLPSRQNQDTAPVADAQPAENLTTDFQADNTSAQANTDAFTEDALKQAAAAMQEEMQDSPAPDLYLDDPFEDIDTPPAAKKQDPATASTPTPEESAPKKADPMPDVFADLDTPPAPDLPKPEPKAEVKPEPKPESKPEPTPPQSAPEPKAETAPAQKPEATPPTSAAPAPSGPKRKSRNQRRRAKLATQTEAAPASLATQPTSAAPKKPEPLKPETADAPTTKPQDMELAPHNKRDDAAAKQDVDRAFKEMNGDIPDPAEQEIEAAYMQPAQANPDFLVNAPKPDISALLQEEAPTPTPEKAEGKPTPKEDAPAAPTTPETFAAPDAFAAPEPVATKPAAPKPEPKPQSNPDPKPAPKPDAAPTPASTETFSAPETFTETAATAKKTEPLPWEKDAAATEDNSWDLGDAAIAPLPPAPDIYATETPSEAKTEQPQPEKPAATGLPLPFLNTKDTPPPELPTNGKNGKRPIPKGASSKKLMPLLGGIAALLILFVGYKMFTNTPDSQERLARFTGALESAPQPQNPSPQPKTGALAPAPLPQKNISNQELDLLNQELEEDLARLTPPQDSSPQAQIDFVDVTKDEAEKPIVAAPNEPLSGEKGFVASLQDAIKSERQKQGKPENPQEESPTATKTREEKFFETNDMKQQVQDELAAYRAALSTSQSPLPVKPNDFFSDIEQNGGVLPPKQTAPAGAQGLPQSEVYTQNPYNLPIIAEPESNPVQTVRSLDNFDVAMFEPPKPKVRIPKGLKPRLRASDFPELNLLSLIPNKGLIAFANGREGALLIGESVEGWELYAVTGNHAEFRSGQRKYYLNLE